LLPALSLQQDRDGIDGHDLADAVEQRLKQVFKHQVSGYSVVEDLEVLGLTSAILSTSASDTEQYGEAAGIRRAVFLILCGVH